ncbi:hypothetical protein VNO77_17344 [Canavalia gladiata]|uniref:Uncharacterized protein n=1 Tax=Canavalia gladiata TaxID=3824 RepID=A0AAN9LJ09_CANGL
MTSFSIAFPQVPIEFLRFKSWVADYANPLVRQLPSCAKLHAKENLANRNFDEWNSKVAGSECVMNG